MKIPFKIIAILNGKQTNYVSSHKTEVKANIALQRLIDKNEKEIIFPVRYLNCHKIIPCIYEYVILKLKDENDNNVTKLRNEYGEFVDHVISNDEEWVIYDKHQFDKEETFWVYGYHPKLQRKTFSFIFEEILKPKASKRYEFATIVVYRNKLLIDSTSGLDLITCKNESDCIRLYNQLEEWSHIHKLKYCLFNGDCVKYKGKYTRFEESKQYWFNKIKTLTNWDDTKIRRKTTRP